MPLGNRILIGKMRRLGRGLRVRACSSQAENVSGAEWGRAELPLLNGAAASQLKSIAAIGAVAPEWTDLSLREAGNLGLM